MSIKSIDTHRSATLIIHKFLTVKPDEQVTFISGPHTEVEVVDSGHLLDSF